MYHNVFVYGSLLSDLHNHRLLGDSPYLDAAWLPDGLFAMVSLGSFPALVHDPEGPPIVGELYVVDDATLARLDRLEGHPHFYRRQQVGSITRDAHPEASCTAWVYVLAAHDRVFDAECYVVDGDWRAYHESRQDTARRVGRVPR